MRFKVIDEIVPEPAGGAHEDWDRAAELLKDSLIRNLEDLADVEVDELLSRRYERFRILGEFA